MTLITAVEETYYEQGDEELDYDDDAPTEEATPVQPDDHMHRTTTPTTLMTPTMLMTPKVRKRMPSTNPESVSPSKGERRSGLGTVGNSSRRQKYYGYRNRRNC